MLKAAGAVCVVGFAGVLVMCGVAYAMTEVPPVKEMARAQSTVIEWRDGSVMTKIGGRDRRAVSLEEIPDHLEHAVIAAEDGAFYNQPLGISVKGIARALWVTLTTDQLQGGSTITQQYAQKAYLADGRSLRIKVKELFLTLKLEQRYSKDEILENYLNTIYFGRGTYGVEAASQAYFHKHVQNLNVAQSAFIAGILNGPGFLDPANGQEAKKAMKARWEYVLGRMVDKGWLSAAKVQRMEFPAVAQPTEDDDTYGGPQGYIVRMVEERLTEKMGYSEKEIRTQGLRIRTTLSKKMQRNAVRAVKATLPKNWPYKRANVGIVSVKPGKGDVLAMFGGRNALKDYYNNVFEDTPQLGSSFKPYVLAAALREGIGLRSRFNGDSPRTFANGYEVGNDGGVDYGMIDLPTATQNSVNTVYVDLGLEVGVDNVINAATDAGLPAKALNSNRNASLFLGTATVTPVKQIAGIATFAAEGVYAKPHIIKSIRNADGTLLRKVEPTTHRAFSEDVAADVVYAMRQVAKPGGTGVEAALENRAIAGKTGTTQKNRAAWFVGYTPQVATAVTVFNPNFKPMVNLPVYGTISSTTAPVDIWHAYMAKAMKGKPIKEFPEPAWVGDTLNPPPPDTPSPNPTETKTSTPGPTATQTPEEPTEEPTAPPTTEEPPTTPPTTPPETETESPPGEGGGDDDDCGALWCPASSNDKSGDKSSRPEPRAGARPARRE